MSFMQKRKRRVFRINEDEILFLSNKSNSDGTVGIIKSGKERTLFLATANNEEIAIFLDEDDLLVCSVFNTGSEYEKAISSMLYLLRDMESPIIALDKNHPTSNRLNMVVSIGDFIELTCKIKPGTHVNQKILCSCDGLNGTTIESIDKEIIIEGSNFSHKIEKFYE